MSEKDDEKRKTIYEQEERLRKRMADVEHKIVVIRDKGGFGKSLTTVNLAVVLAWHGHPHSAGILDAAVHGPCVPKMLDMIGQQIVTEL